MILGDEIDDSPERYSFTWNGKKQAMQLAQKPTTATLKPNKEKSKNWDETQNLYIEGDNLEVLKVLQKSYANKVKLIYIDPPYNTGKDFVYKDNFHDSMQNYLEVTGQVDGEGNKVGANTETSGRYHTDWLNMMYPRLKLARNLLTEDGVIFISIDDSEMTNLKKQMDEIFGEQNFLGEIIWQSATDNNASQISIQHEYILAYSKSISMQPKWIASSEKAELINSEYRKLKSKLGNNFNEIQAGLQEFIKKNESKLSGVAHYKFVDSKGVYYPGNSSNTVDGSYKFDIIHPVTGKPTKKPEKGWRWPLSTFELADERGDVEWGKDETTIPKIKKRLETATELLKSYYYEDNRYWTRYMTDLMGKKVFENPKSLNLLKYIFKFVVGKEDVVMDFFSGSGSIADAIMQQNAADGGERKYIAVQLPEVIDASSEGYKVGYRTIPDIAEERIRRAGDKIISDNPELEGKLDIGFKVFELQKSNLKKWNTDTPDLLALLGSIQDNLEPGSSPDDLVYEIMLKQGLELTLPIEGIIFDSMTIYKIAFGALFIVLGKSISSEAASKIVKIIKEDELENVSVVLQDTGFASDSDKLNSIEILNAGGVQYGDILSI